MFAIFLVFSVLVLSQADGKEPESASWPLFEFWNPLTWITPRFSSETIFQILRSGRDSNRKLHQQFKKALLPASLFFGNIRAQRAAWDGEKKGPGKRRPNSKNPSKRGNKH